MTRIIALALSFGLLSGGLSPAMAAEPDHLKLYTSKRGFDTVKEDLQIAITNHGLVLDHTSHISAMLDRTGKDLGASKTIYGKAESLQFCSASVSRRNMEADPSNIIFCPYIIVIYTLPQDPKMVYVGYRRPMPAGSEASRASTKAIEDLLDGIVKEALNLK
ncbi:MAG: hypothetical protein A3D32_05315 [Candidatus Muproteobacteria bacterium RIFCSPHIGHO2_02_FULL_60_13]|nr:MAG: hypothetical protein A3D32_05315 [Candidatus Muproteobacteria bacterium RIFCSPHIGHO2_02_FULL_60_13]